MFRVSLIPLAAPVTMATFDCTVTQLVLSNPTNAAINVSVVDGNGHPLVPGSEIPATGRVDFIGRNNPSVAVGGFSISASVLGLYFSAEWSPR